MWKINNNNFDALRVLFAMTVAVAHFFELSSMFILKGYQVFFNTRLAIAGFFVISGFLVAKSFENSSSTKDYIIRRVKRIFPAYFFVVFASAFLLFFISKNSIPDYFFNLQFYKYLVANLTFQNYFEPCLPAVFDSNKLCAVNGALWTLKIEEAFYISLPILYWVFRNFKVNLYVLIAASYILSVIYFNYFLAQDNYRIAKQLPGAYSFFVAGILCYKKFDFLLRWKHRIIIPCLLVFILEQYVLNVQVLKPLAYSFMVFYLAYNFSFLNNFGKYGDFTYGIYIYHFPVIQVFVSMGLFNLYSPLLMFVCTMLLIVILSILSWYYIELPFLPKSRKDRYKFFFNSRFKNLK